MFEGISVSEDADQDLRALALQPGERLNRVKLGESLRALYATGHFANLQVEAERQGETGVALVYRATPNYFVGRVSATGAPGPPTNAQLADAARLHLGEVYTRGSADRGLELMKDVLRENGYYQPVITVEERRDPSTHQVELRFDVQPGLPATIGDVIVEGSPGYTIEEIREITRLRQGEVVTAQRTSQAIERLRERYSRDRRLEAQVRLTERKFHAEGNTLDYLFMIERGPTVEIEVSGADVNQRRLRQLVPVYAEHAVDEDLLNEGRRNLLDYFQTQGYFDAEVQFRRESSDDHLQVVYMAERGERHILAGIVVRGNQYFDSQTVRERLQMREAGGLFSRGRFSQELLNQDVQNVVNLYRSNGFQDVQVRADAQDDYDGVAGRMMVFLDIEEGPQTRVASLTIEGAEKVKPEDLREMLTTSEGQPYSTANVATDRDLITNYYFNLGFSEVSFEATAAPDPENANRVHVAYRLREGEQVFVDRVLLSGLDSTKTGVALRQVQFQSGDPLSQTDMLETQRRLYDLGVFNEVKLAVQNRDGEAKRKNVLLQFTEARRWTFNYGLGVEIQSGAFGVRTAPEGQAGASPTVSFDVSRLNVGGRAHTLSFKSHLGRLQQRALLTYDAPRLMSVQNLRMTLNLFYDNSLNVRTFTSERMESSAQLEHRLDRVSTFLYRFTYRRVQASALQISPEAVPLLSRPVRVGLPSISYIRDKRDDPLESHNGNYSTVDAGVASGIFGSEADFARVLVQNTTYHPFQGKRWVFARNTQVGFAKPFGSDQEDVNGPVIPLPERFFAGGANTLRGFAINQAGPRDLSTGQVLGGEAVFINSLELRTPPVALPYVGENLSFALFHDAGNVFASATDMGRSLVRWAQKDRRLCTQEATSSQCNFAYLSHALGVGIRYRTPIGPVRLDVGYNLNPPTFPYFDDPLNRVGFHSARTGRFQFAFSVGQTF